MPLPTPILDDRSYQQLRDELVARIPIYLPEWTDHNASDPGVTLIELFSYLGETLLFRFNQIPEATKLAYLKLLQVPLRPAVAAQGFVTLTTERPDGVLVEIGKEARAGKLPFEIGGEVKVMPLDLRALGKIGGNDGAGENEADADGDGEDDDVSARAVDALGGLADDEVEAPYRPRVLDVDPAAPNARAVNFDLAVDGMLWLAVLKTDKTVVDKVRGSLLSIAVVPDTAAKAPAAIDPCPGAGVVAPTPAVIWQISTGGLADGAPVYREIVPEGDTTSGLTRPGIVRLRVPKDPRQAGNFDLEDPNLDGAGDRPPPVEDDELAPKVLFWLRAFRPDGGHLGKLLWAGINAAPVSQVRTAAPEMLGTGDAQPGQSFALVSRPVIEGSLVVEVEEADGWIPWTAKTDFAASGESDRHFVVDKEAGRVTFGNGLQGRAPQIGERIRARTYKTGGGSAGNLTAGAIDKMQNLDGVKVKNPLGTWGGADAESVERALERIPGELRRRDRAVCADDFRELALATPGGQVARAEVLPLYHPRFPAIDAAGVVSVVVWPRDDLHHPGSPLPDRTLLSQVCRWLDTRRLVTTELYVLPPVYRRVAVAVGLNVKPGYGVEAVRRWVELVLRQYLAPLPPYGPSGQGWPLGRRVHGPELEAAALQVEGVEFLEGLSVAGWNKTSKAWDVGTVNLERWEVPELATITVVAGAPLDPGVAPAPPPVSKRPVPIPRQRKDC